MSLLTKGVWDISSNIIIMINIYIALSFEVTKSAVCYVHALYHVYYNKSATDLCNRLIALLFTHW